MSCPQHIIVGNRWIKRIMKDWREHGDARKIIHHMTMDDEVGEHAVDIIESYTKEDAPGEPMDCVWAALRVGCKRNLARQASGISYTNNPLYGRF